MRECVFWKYISMCIWMYLFIYIFMSECVYDTWIVNGYAMICIAKRLCYICTCKCISKYLHKNGHWGVVSWLQSSCHIWMILIVLSNSRRHYLFLGLDMPFLKTYTYTHTYIYIYIYIYIYERERYIKKSNIKEGG